MDRTTETHTPVYEDAEGKISKVSGYTLDSIYFVSFLTCVNVLCAAVGVCA